MFNNEKNSKVSKLIPESSISNEAGYDFFESCLQEIEQIEVYRDESGKLLMFPDGPESIFQNDLLYKVVRTPMFKAKFGDWQLAPNESSQAVDERTGEPCIVFHATQASIPIEEGVGTRPYRHTLSHDPINKSGPIRTAYFSSERADSLNYGNDDDDKERPVAFPAFLNIRNPQQSEGTTEETDGMIFTSRIKEGRDIEHYIVLNNDQIIRIPFNPLGTN